MSRRILVYTTASQIPHCFSDWFDFADWLKQQNEAGQIIGIKRWEYV